MESLSNKLLDALENASSPLNEQRAMQVLGSRLPNLVLNRTFVGPSPVAGQGLFARKNFSQGTIITCYPGDGIVEENDMVYWGDHVIADESLDLDDENWDEDYLLSLNEDIGLVGLPQLDQDPAYLGHFANDGVSKIPTNYPELMQTYLEESKARSNTMELELLSCHVVLVATRNIVQGEEIFLSYGPEYWMQKPLFGKERAD